MNEQIPDCLGDIGNRPLQDPACIGCFFTSDCIGKFDEDRGNGVEIPEEAHEED
jgi:hypothetical protein